MTQETYKERDAPEFIDGDDLEVYPTINGQVCIRQTLSKASGDYPCISVHPANIPSLIEALKLVKPEAEAWAEDHAKKNI